MDLTRFTPVGRVRTALIALAVIVGLALAGIVVWKVFFAGTAAKRVAAEAVVGQEAAEGQSRANDCPGLPAAGASSPAATDAERNGS